MKSLTHRQKTTTFDDSPEDGDEQGPMPWLLMKPGSTANIVWDMLGLLLIVWDCFMIPLAFFGPSENFMASVLVGWVGRLYWTLNIPAGFLTGFVDRTGKLVMSKAKIARRYAMTWLAFDGLMMCSDWLELTVSGADSMQYHRIGIAFRSLRMIRTVRLLRMVRAPVLSSQLSESIMCEELMLVSHILKIMALLLGAAHLVACVWYGIGSADTEAGWVRASPVRDGSLWSRYVLSLHSTLSMFLGETLIDSVSLRERCFAVAILFFGFIFSSSLVSSLTTAMTRLQMLSSQQSVHMSQLKRFLVNRGISRPLALRVQRNAQHVLLEQRQNMPEASVELLKVISDPLKREIHFEVYSDLLMAHPLFFCFRTTNPAGIRKVCHTCVTLVSLSTGDILFSELEAPTQPRMFFVKTGRSSYQQEMGDDQTVQHAQWLCEQTLWTTWAHCGTFRAVTDSTLLALDAERFQGLFSGSGGSSDSHLTRYAEAFVLALNRAGEGGLTDLGSLDADLDETIAHAFPELQPDAEDEEPSSPRSSTGSFTHRKASWLWGAGAAAVHHMAAGRRGRSPSGIAEQHALHGQGAAARAAAAAQAFGSRLWESARHAAPLLRRSTPGQTENHVQPFGIAPSGSS